jgi:alpha-beta hydrolase superfamily lysophospholipase
MQELNEAKSVKRRIFRWIKIILIVYCLVGIAVYYLQDSILLRPVKLPKDYKYSFSFPFREVNIPYDRNTNINIVQFAAKDSTARGVVLYFHGNKMNILRYSRFVPNFTKWGYEVWMIDYPGYGKSTGEFSEKLVYEWTLAMYKLARKQFSPGSIIIYGKSLGTGIAAQLASIRDCKRLILETPYYSITSLARRYFWMYPVNQIVRYKIPTYEYLSRVTAPVTIFHGTKDELIPYSNAVRLKEVLKNSDEFFTIAGGTHRNLNEYPFMKAKLDSLLNH